MGSIKTIQFIHQKFNRTGKTKNNRAKTSLYTIKLKRKKQLGECMTLI